MTIFFRASLSADQYEPYTREALLKGRISTVDLLVLTGSDQLIFMLKLYFFFFYKTTYLNEKVNLSQTSP
jgi:hypothetical protein